MVRRSSWLARIEDAWKDRPIVWLSGVRRAGKTMLSQSLCNTDYYDCELPRVRASMEDPEAFLARHKGRRIVLDEIHRLGNPSQLLKIAADHYPSVRVLATGSSTIGASRKFRDTLTGRKVTIWLTPMDTEDVRAFRRGGLEHRLVNGGLPPLYLASRIREEFFREWMDDYWARDIEELFRIQQKYPFQRFVELLFRQSGGIFEANAFARPCEVSRMTIVNYLSILEATHVANVLRPFSSRRAVEIVAAPKVYGFDTGFVCFYRGWNRVGTDNRGWLWEHLVLNELQSTLQQRRIGYWRDKHGNEVDFVIARHGKPPVAVECKWSAKSFDPAGMTAFERAYPGTEMLLVAADAGKAGLIPIRRGTVRLIGLSDVQKTLSQLCH
jgi:predicted AAA+ superfamily ATPase